MSDEKTLWGQKVENLEVPIRSIHEPSEIGKYANFKIEMIINFCAKLQISFKLVNWTYFLVCRRKKGFEFAQKFFP